MPDFDRDTTGRLLAVDLVVMEFPPSLLTAVLALAAGFIGRETWRDSKDRMFLYGIAGGNSYYVCNLGRRWCRSVMRITKPRNSATARLTD
jgi:hypothetical protein